MKEHVTARVRNHMANPNPECLTPKCLARQCILLLLRASIITLGISVSIVCLRYKIPRPKEQRCSVLTRNLSGGDDDIRFRAQGSE